MATQSGPDDTARPPDSPEEEIIYLDWYVRAIQRRWLLIFAGAILGGVIAFSYASSRPLRYEGVTTLLVVPPSEPNGTQINPATFRAIVENASLVAQVIAELKLGEGEHAFTPHRFLDEALIVEEVRGTNIVRIRVTLYDRNTAADASRRLASKAIELTQSISQQDGAAIQGQMKEHLADAETRRATAEKELLTYKQGAQVDLMKEDADAQLKERGDLLRLVVDIEAEQARLAAALTEIKRQQPLLTATRMPAAEEAMQRSDADATAEREKAARDRAAARGDELKGRKPAPAGTGEVNTQHLDLSNPYVNPVYQTLDYQIATTRTRIAALQKERDELIDVKKIGGKELSQLSELYKRQIEQARLQASFDLATRVYGDLVVRYEQSRTQPLGNTAQLQVIDNALPPDRPVSRWRLQYALFGVVAGLVITVMLSLLWETRSRQI
jgi:succinoglycan biosynthesis transport protein ExoP